MASSLEIGAWSPYAKPGGTGIIARVEFNWQGAMADSAFTTELETHRRYLLRIATLQLRDTALAEDVVQDTLVAALQGENGFSGKSSLRTWLTGILKHKVVDAIRRNTTLRICIASPTVLSGSACSARPGIRSNRARLPIAMTSCS